MRRKLIYLSLVVAIFLTTNVQTIVGNAGPNTQFSDVTDNYAWAQEAINALVEQKVLDGIDGKTFAPSAPVTKEQFTKMLVLALGFEANDTSDTGYHDVQNDRWSVVYINAAKGILADDSFGSQNFHPEENYTREKCAYAVSMALEFGNNEKNLLDKNCIATYFEDGNDITASLKIPVAMAAERGIVKGSDGLLRPKGNVTRAEAAVMLYRAIQYQNRNSQSLFITQTPLVGKSTVSLAQAKKWAQNSGAHQRFIDIADYYWKYGELTGIRPEILYGQAAKETAYGKYTGQVKPEQNNWAGIKIKNPTGDKPEDHETFATPEDGVRAHFNHMSQYAGVDPVGVPHDRYYVLNTVAWRGTVKYVEQLGGKWAPDITYGYNIVTKILRAMENTK